MENDFNQNICSSCGANNINESDFCTNCGMKLSKMSSDLQATQPDIAPIYQANDNNYMENQYQEPINMNPTDPYQGISPEPSYGNEPQYNSSTLLPNQPAYDPGVGYQDNAVNPVGGNNNNKKTFIIIGGILAAVAIISVVCLILVNIFSFKVIDAAKLYSVEYSGYNGEGEAAVDQVNSDIFEDLISDTSEKGMERAILLSTISFSISPKETLKNGDVVTVEIDYDKKDFKDAKIKLKNAKKEYTVAGLKDAVTVDVFEDLVINFTGISSYGEAEYDTAECTDFVKDSVYFSLEPKRELKNGDTVTVTFDYNEYAAEEKSYKLDPLTKDYVVAGLQEAQEIDIFEGVQVVYEGDIPYVSASIDTTNCIQYVKDNVYFSFAESAYSVKAGDVLTIEAEYYGDPLEDGYIFTSETKTITVAGIDEYIATVDGVDLTALLADMPTKFPVIKEGDTSFTDISYYDLDNVYSFSAVKSSKLAASYFMKIKEDFGSSSVNNGYLQIYDCVLTVKTDDDKTEDINVFVTLVATNLIKAADGTIKYDKELETYTRKSIELAVASVEESYTLVDLTPK